MLGFNVTAFFSNAYVHWEYVKLNREVLEERRRRLEEEQGNGGAMIRNGSFLVDQVEELRGERALTVGDSLDGTARMGARAATHAVICCEDGGKHGGVGAVGAPPGR
ncbi:uncharacterized protein Tco025E_09726 [Trypanosoma conorhini]|uniref:Uncharacterized protein n=1 Tax=Trypanosoma conorhini TaxID=83891 RepID=A0A3R7KLA4_9TRYP|nr:uncharacterized protein Tco025E_09726 [Trypanosoma conorhini]RNE96715.1 hypothetical protein Tco025E_09726 [Trypanosoma conorhini]